jgi:hypothetical protein
MRRTGALGRDSNLQPDGYEGPAGRAGWQPPWLPTPTRIESIPKRWTLAISADPKLARGVWPHIHIWAAAIEPEIIKTGGTRVPLRNKSSGVVPMTGGFGPRGTGDTTEARLPGVANRACSVPCAVVHRLSDADYARLGVLAPIRPAPRVIDHGQNLSQKRKRPTSLPKRLPFLVGDLLQQRPCDPFTGMSISMVSAPVRSPGAGIRPRARPIPSSNPTARMRASPVSYQAARAPLAEEIAAVVGCVVSRWWA